jgi:hypothetical protein
MSLADVAGKRSKICSVCFSEAESYHLNYGVSSCFSCRAFFRRAIQKGRYLGPGSESSYTCYSAGNCDVLRDKRASCQKCRFEACVAAGMRPESVLIGREKTFRFRRMIKRQMEESGELPAGTGEKTLLLTLEEKTETLMPQLKFGVRGESGRGGRATTTNVGVKRKFLEDPSEKYPSLDNAAINRASYQDQYPSVYQPSSEQPVDLSHHLFDDQHYSQQSTITSASCRCLLAPNRKLVSFNEMPKLINVNKLVEANDKFEKTTALTEASYEPYGPIYEQITCSNETVTKCNNFNEPQPPVWKQRRDNCPSKDQVDQCPRIKKDGKCRYIVLNLDTMISKKIEEIEIEEPVPEKREEIEVEEPVPYLLSYDNGDAEMFCPDYRTKDRTVRQRFQTHLKHIERTWKLALRHLKPEPEFVIALLSLHCGYPDLMTRSLFARHLRSLSKLLKDHAEQQPEFIQLQEEERRVLIQTNSTLFVTYLFSGYLNARSGREQIMWLFPHRTPRQLRKGGGKHLKLVSAQVLNASIKLLPWDIEDLPDFLDCLARVKHFDRSQTCLVSQLCLFARKDSHQFDKIMTLAEWAQVVFGGGAESGEEVLDLISALGDAQVRLDTFATAWSEADREPTSFTTTCIVPAYGTDETRVVANKFDLLDQCIQSVPFDISVLKDIFIAGQGGRVNPRLPLDVAATVFEKFRKVLTSHNEFAALPPEAAMNAIKSNIFVGMALYAAKFESGCKTAKDQISWISGSSEVCSKIYHSGDDDGLPVNMLNLDSSVGLFKLTELTRFQELSGIIADLVKDAATYRLLLLFLLTSDLGADLQYLSMFRRRLPSLGDDNGEMMVKFSNGIAQAREMAGLIGAYLCRSAAVHGCEDTLKQILEEEDV